MQPTSMIFNLQFTHGLPLCLSGFSTSHPLTLSHEIADHDRRREAMKRKNSQGRVVVVGTHDGDQEMGIISVIEQGNFERLLLLEAEEEITKTLEVILDGDLVIDCCFSCTAKAA